jgi:hypothetical protein
VIDAGLYLLAGALFTALVGLYQKPAFSDFEDVFDYVICVLIWPVEMLFIVVCLAARVWRAWRELR